LSLPLLVQDLFLFEPLFVSTAKTLLLLKAFVGFAW